MNKISAQKRGFILAMGILLVTPMLAWGELGARRDLDPAAAAKIARMEAEAHRQGSASDMNKPKGLTKAAKCNVSVGNVTVQKGAMAPREVNTFVKGDVISVCK